MFDRLTPRLRRFHSNTDGSASLEAVIFLPLVLVILTATFALHDAFRYKALNTKAAFTISDALSRETEAIDNDYLDGMVTLLEFLTRSEGPYSLRVTLVRYDGDGDIFESVWSQTRGNFDEMTTEIATDLRDQLPMLLDNERVIVVETATDYVPPFPIPGLVNEGLFYNFVFTRPRFAPQLVWADDPVPGA